MPGTAPAWRPLQWESFMAIVNALAGIMVSDLTTAEAWYEQLLSRPADARPMEGLAGWKLADGGGIQVFEDKDRAGSSTVTDPAGNRVVFAELTGQH